MTASCRREKRESVMNKGAPTMVGPTVAAQIATLGEVIQDCQKTVCRMLQTVRGPTVPEGPTAASPPESQLALLTRHIQALNVLQTDLEELEKNIG